MTIGPVQLVVIGFEGDVLECTVLNELGAAVAACDIQLIDFLVIEKDDDGQVWGSEVSVIYDDDEESDAWGGLTFDLVDQGPGKAEVFDADDLGKTRLMDMTYFGINPIEINELIHQIPVGTSAILALFEHSWARKLHEATLEVGGKMLAQGMVDEVSLAILENEMESAQVP